ncbi:MAG: hypothetical protein HY842_17490, partial [Bacteroidetes bacterium]|nr:hypothetical protein [Bacteroidota bacterium]
MANIFLTVTDLELMAAQVVKGIFVLILCFGSIFNLLKAFKAATLRWKVLRGCMAVVFILAVLPV